LSDSAIEEADIPVVATSRDLNTAAIELASKGEAADRAGALQ
jgi:hypothetical protein